MKLEFYETQYDNIDNTFYYKVSEEEWYQYQVDKKEALLRIFELFTYEEIKDILRKNGIEFNPYSYEEVKEKVRTHMYLFKFDLQDYYYNAAMIKYYSEL